jgi:hypothetical protein
MDVARAIAYAQEGLKIHASWLVYIESGYATSEQQAIGGNSAWHSEWVARYRLIERELSVRCAAVG